MQKKIVFLLKIVSFHKIQYCTLIKDDLQMEKMPSNLLMMMFQFIHAYLRHFCFFSSDCGPWSTNLRAHLYFTRTLKCEHPSPCTRRCLSGTKVYLIFMYKLPSLPHELKRGVPKWRGLWPLCCSESMTL